MKKFVLASIAALLAVACFAETDYPTLSRVKRLETLQDRQEAVLETSGDDATFQDDVTVSGDLSVLGSTSVEALDVDGDITLVTGANILADTNYPASLAVEFPARKTAGETNVAQLVLVSTDTNAVDTAVADIAGVRAMNDGGTNTAFGWLRVVLDDVLPLDRIAEAHARVDSGRKVGSLIVRP